MSFTVRGLLILVALLFSDTSIASQNALKESEAKALLLYNFAKFTTWPGTAFNSNQDPLIIGVIGPNPFGKTLRSFKGKRIRGRKIDIRHFRTPEDYTKSHILFCNVKSSRALKDLIDELDLEKNHVLTVGDFEQFAESGGVIGLDIRGNRLIIKFNSRAAKRDNLYLSENLVSLAEKVP